MSPTLPALFLAHGNPLNALERNRFTEDWRRLHGEPPKPRAILCISAHWCTRGTWITAQEKSPPTLHDFAGFPAALFACQYPCPSDPALARGIAERLRCAQVQPTPDWGLDHGSWSLLMHLYPQADIPALQLSLDLSRDARFHLSLGAELGQLRDQGILIIGSGNIVHNIQKWMREPDGPFHWAQQFDEAVAKALRDRDLEALAEYAGLPGARDAVPTVEHFLPLLYIAGMRRPGDELVMSDFEPTSLENCSMRSVRIG